MTSYGENALVRSLSFLAEKQGAIANNLANVDTTSFKRRLAVAESAGSFQSLLDKQLTAISYTEQADMARGTIRETGNDFDVGGTLATTNATAQGVLNLATSGRIWLAGLKPSSWLRRAESNSILRVLRGKRPAGKLTRSPVAVVVSVVR